MERRERVTARTRAGGSRHCWTRVPANSAMAILAGRVTGQSDIEANVMSRKANLKKKGDFFFKALLLLRNKRTMAL
jgi:hypothetical protein